MLVLLWFGYYSQVRPDKTGVSRRLETDPSTKGSCKITKKRSSGPRISV